MYTKTSQFILPTIAIEGNFSDLEMDGFVNAYSGSVTDDPEAWGEFVYLLFDSQVLSVRREQELLSHPKFTKVEKVDDGLLFCFCPDKEDMDNVITPFINGEYSKISLDFALANYPAFTISILQKDEKIRDRWEEKLGIEFTDDMEVWSRPEKEQEIYGYKSIGNEQPNIPTVRRSPDQGDIVNSRSEGERSPESTDEKS